MLSHILANWSDPFVLNGLIEAGAGLVSLLIPTLMFSTAKGNPVATYLARWWAAAVIGIGFACLLISTVPASNIARQYAGAGFLCYHVLLTIMHTRLVDTHRARDNTNLYAGFVVHVMMCVVFILHLYPLGTHNAVLALLMA